MLDKEGSWRAESQRHHGERCREAEEKLLACVRLTKDIHGDVCPVNGKAATFEELKGLGPIV